MLIVNKCIYTLWPISFTCKNIIPVRSGNKHTYIIQGDLPYHFSFSFYDNFFQILVFGIF